MTDREIVFRLLARALLDIRIASHDGKSNVAFHLADLFHTVPYQLSKIDDSQQQYGEILENLRERGTQKGIAPWISNALEDIAFNNANPS